MATQKEVAAHLFVSDRQVRYLAELPGAPKPARRDAWDIDEWRRFYLNYLRSSRRDKDDGDTEDEREAQENEDEKRLKNKERWERILIARVKRRILAKRYAPVELVSAAISRTANELRTRVESWPSRLKKVWPDMPTEAGQLLQKEFAAALNDLANIRIDLSDYDVGDIERDLDRIEALESDPADDGSGVG
ncbi:hypothetical protein [Klebsiella aerogenes]|uniref:hypothetical protein n=1 Tax=Klebsiella aerogenes TaxID=548 RepID=UPI0034D1F87B